MDLVSGHLWIWSEDTYGSGQGTPVDLVWEHLLSWREIHVDLV